MKTHRKPWFNLGQHDLRDYAPEAIKPVIENGLLEGLFRNALTPQLLFPQGAGLEPIAGRKGTTIIKTRTGLLAPATEPLQGADPTPKTYGLEQWSVVLDRFGNSIDTDMDGDAIAIASIYGRDVQTLAINAGQSLNLIARNRLYGAYAGGRTWTTGSGSSATALVVESTNGFETINVNGLPQPVSAANPLTIKIGSTTAQVKAVDPSTKTLTLVASASWAAGAAVVASNAPFSVRAAGRSTAYDAQPGDVATLAKFRAAVAHMRRLNVPTINGAYQCHLDSVTENQLFDDPEFVNALKGRVDSPVLTELSIGRFVGIDWIRNEETATTAGGEAGGLTVRQPIVFGDEALVSSPAEWLGKNRDETAGAITVSMVEAPGTGVGVELIVRGPQDRLGLNVSTTWSWVGDFGVPSDVTGIGSPARFKRAVIVEHVGA